MGDSENSNEQGVTHTVQPGETLSKIAKEYYGDSNQHTRIFEANRDQLDNPNDLQVGQVLTIPPATS